MLSGVDVVHVAFPGDVLMINVQTMFLLETFLLDAYDELFFWVAGHQLMNSPMCCHFIKIETIVYAVNL